MGWEEWTNRMVDSGNLDQAAIYGKNPTYLWGATGGLDQINPQELEKVGNHFEQKSDELFTTGFWVGSEKYIVTAAPGRPSDDCVHVKRDKTGIFIYRTRQTYFLGHYPEAYANRLAQGAGTIEAMVGQLPEPF